MVILLSGYRRSGKDTAAAYLKEHYAMKRYGLADSLKIHTAKKYRLDLKWFNDQSLKEKPLKGLPVKKTDVFSVRIQDSLQTELASEDDAIYWTPRALLILEGNLARTVDPDHWVNSVFFNMDKNETNIISDFRFKREYSRFVELLGSDQVVTVRIDRFSAPPSNHPSETELDDFNFDYTVENDGNLQELYDKLDKVVAEIFKEKIDV